jgi:hypothetical protein
MALNIGVMVVALSLLLQGPQVLDAFALNSFFLDKDKTYLLWQSQSTSLQ